MFEIGSDKGTETISFNQSIVYRVSENPFLLAKFFLQIRGSLGYSFKASVSVYFRH